MGDYEFTHLNTHIYTCIYICMYRCISSMEVYLIFKISQYKTWLNGCSDEEKMPPERWDIKTNAKEPHSEQSQPRATL